MGYIYLSGKRNDKWDIFIYQVKGTANEIYLSGKRNGKWDIFIYQVKGTANGIYLFIR